MNKGNEFSDPKIKVVSHKARHLRHEHDCLNCGRHVEDRFCSHCGQENTEKRQSFSHLLGHILEDLTHYESGFWRTIRYLLFRPGLLTNIYLAGKRAAFVAPVKLYIFVSFLCFFLPGILPDFSKPEHTATPATVVTAPTDSITAKDTLTDEPVAPIHAFRTNVMWTGLHYENNELVFEKPHDYRTIAELDSAQRTLPPGQRYNWLQYRMAKRIIGIYDHNTNQQITEKFKESFSHNLSKALFFYMPFFAFFMWVFHSKKRWLYFDHAIFTLHYFSLVLLLITILNVFFCITSALENMPAIEWVEGTVLIVTLGWMFVYFFMAHHRVYKSKRFMSVFKGILLFGINIFAIIFVLMLFMNITLFTLH